MWLVKFTVKAEKEIRELIKSHRLSENDRQVIGSWIRLVKMHGPDVVKNGKDWDDHPLEREWSGFRSSAYSYAGRIVYKVIGDKIIVVVVRITPDHDYRKDG